MKQCETCIFKNYKDTLTACSLNELNKARCDLNYQICRNIPIVKDKLQPKKEYRCRCYEPKNVSIVNQIMNYN
jgi:hypothetical protein